MVRVRKLNHLVLRVRNVDRTVAFYHDVLGMEIVARMGNAGVFFKFTDNHHDLACFALGDNAIGPFENQVGMYHFALEVGSLEELRDARDELSRIGALVGMSDHGLSKSLYVKDPDGNEMEILWNIPREEWDGQNVAQPIKPLDIEAEIEKRKGVTASV